MSYIFSILYWITIICYQLPAPCTQVLPALMHKHEALSLFSDFYRDAMPMAEAGKCEPITQTDFIEALARAAIFIGVLNNLLNLAPLCMRA